MFITIILVWPYANEIHPTAPHHPSAKERTTFHVKWISFLLRDTQFFIQVDFVLRELLCAPFVGRMVRWNSVCVENWTPLLRGIEGGMKCPYHLFLMKITYYICHASIFSLFQLELHSGLRTHAIHFERIFLYFNSFAIVIYLIKFIIWKCQKN